MCAFFSFHVFSSLHVTNQSYFAWKPRHRVPSLELVPHTDEMLAKNKHMAVQWDARLLPAASELRLVMKLPTDDVLGFLRHITCYFSRPLSSKHFAVVDHFYTVNTLSRIFQYLVRAPDPGTYL